MISLSNKQIWSNCLLFLLHCIMEKINIQKYNKNIKKLKVNIALFITGGSVHHGNEEILSKTESERSMCQGQRSIYFPDVRLLPVHRSGLWVVSFLFLLLFLFLLIISKSVSKGGGLELNQKRAKIKEVTVGKNISFISLKLEILKGLTLLKTQETLFLLKTCVLFISVMEKGAFVKLLDPKKICTYIF